MQKKLIFGFLHEVWLQATPSQIKAWMSKNSNKESNLSIPNPRWKKRKKKNEMEMEHEMTPPILLFFTNPSLKKDFAPYTTNYVYYTFRGIFI